MTRILGVFALAAGTLWAHDPFETSVVSRLQHGRLEVAVTMTFEMVRLLVEDRNDPEPPQLNDATWERDRARLETRARDLYDVTAGGVVLNPGQVTTRIVEGGHVEAVVIYPEPTASPLRIRPRKIERLPPGYMANLSVFDAEENLLGQMLVTRSNLADAELSVDAAVALIAQAVPIPPPVRKPEKEFAVQSKPGQAPAPAQNPTWWVIGAALALVVTAAGFLARHHLKPNPPQIR